LRAAESGGERRRAVESGGERWRAVESGGEVESSGQWKSAHPVLLPVGRPPYPPNECSMAAVMAPHPTHARDVVLLLEVLSHSHLLARSLVHELLLEGRRRGRGKGGGVAQRVERRKEGGRRGGRRV